MPSYSETRSVLMHAFPILDAEVVTAPLDSNGRRHWESMWNAVATSLLRRLDALNMEEFESGFRATAAALGACDAIGREVGTTFLFGDFTRRSIAARFERTRFVEWLGPAELLEAPSGRIRGRVLYYSDSKGRGKLLGADRVVYFFHCSAIVDTGYRSLRGGQLVELTPLYGAINQNMGWMARDVVPLSEIDGHELNA